ncbi:antitoxin VbhA family protein [Tyzzerella sp. OttesenSCG-928-J15]|nr:antitoxin VbhA family protein [Tyzzerella sp. OttesenSCG-928-J15]MDL2288007.1 antitoxin VbhA family protein [Oscillospiraceae bacterium OttesenSCG-928-F05]
MSEKQDFTKEEKHKAWNYAIGMSKIDGGEHSQEFLDLVEKEINGEIPEGETLKRTIEKWKEVGESQEITKEQSRKAWDYAIGMAKVDGGEPPPEVLALVERQINGEITMEEYFKELDKMYKEQKDGSHK